MLTTCVRCAVFHTYREEKALSRVHQGKPHIVPCEREDLRFAIKAPRKGTIL